MVVSEDQRIDFLTNFSSICSDEELDKSTSTIDLCYLLKRFNIQFCMYTIRIGINSRCHNSYKISEQDIKRVCKRFQNAANDGLKIYKEVLSTEDLMKHVRNHGPAIVLVDASLLSCDWCKRNKLISEIRSVWGGTYQGHYITIVGHSHNKILYRDPARYHETCATTTRKLNVARQTQGTDFDVILVKK